ncbi:MAG: hypothetical protein ACFB4J_11885 [Elainellaceae cyanobacterium]
METTFFDRTFRDETGSIVIAQPPNPPLLVWLVATGINLLPTGGNVEIFLETLAFGALFTWAWMELFQGVNYFRRSLGLVVLVLLLLSKLNWAL